MSEAESKLKEVNEFIKEVFNYNGDETQLKHLKEVLPILSKIQNLIRSFVLIFWIFTLEGDQINNFFQENS